MKILIPIALLLLTVESEAQTVKETIQYINEKIDLYNHMDQKWEEPVNGIVKIVNTSSNPMVNGDYWKVNIKNVTFETKESVSTWTTGETLFPIYMKGDIKHRCNTTGRQISVPYITYYIDNDTERQRLLKAFRHLKSITKRNELFDDN